jgi:mRNA-degrading endonuclease toxin of MazEF toxin-antitoxin module
MGNTYSSTFIVAMMTTQKKNDLPTHIAVSSEDYCLDINTTILLEQLRTIDKSRLRDFVGRLSDGTMQKVDEALRISLSLNKERKEETELNEKKENKKFEKEEDFPSDWKSIYIMKRESGEIKIGVSKNVKKRKKNIETSGMMKIANVYKTNPCSNPYEIEAIMHERFKKSRIQGEWFSCDMGTAILALDKVFAEKAKFYIKKYEKNPLDYFAETVNKEIKSGKEYVESLETFIEFIIEISNKKDQQIERIISMAENLQSEIKIKNAELEKYKFPEETV